MLRLLTITTVTFLMLGAATSKADLVFSFDTSEGFTPGLLNGQNGWTVFGGVGAQQPIISDANPFSGDGHIRIAQDPGVGVGTFRGGFSPLDVVDANTPSTLSVQVFISDVLGADYEVIGQTPAEGFLSYRLRFDWQGNIFVLDDLGAGLVSVDTGFSWIQDQYVELQIDFNPLAGTIDYFYGGTNFYSGGLVAGTRVEQVILLADNFQSAGGFGDFDNLSLVQIPEPSTATLLAGLVFAGLIRRKR